MNKAYGKIINAKPFIGRKKSSCAKTNFYLSLNGEQILRVNNMEASRDLLELISTNLPILKDFPFSIKSWVKGGGNVSQMLSILKSIAIGLTKQFPELKSDLKKNTLCWFDVRKVERKKFGFRKARRGQQWLKR